MSSSVMPDSTDSAPRRPRSAFVQRNPIWSGGSGTAVQPSPRKHISRESGIPPFALHTT